MKIVIVTEALATGGAETFVLRLAAALQARGISASLFVLRAELTNHALVRSIAPDVPMAAVHIPLLPLVLKVDGLLFSLGTRFSLVRWIQVRQLRAHLSTVGAELAHSHLFTADLVTARATMAAGTPWVTTMHGDYLAFETQRRNRAARIQNFQAALQEIEGSVSHLVSITDEQTTQLRRLLSSASSRISKIYNGYAAAMGSLATSDSQPEALKPIPTDGFVIGMVARGIRDKGWEVMLAAFQELDLPDAWLVLVGGGAYIDTLRAQVKHPRVIFVGNVVDPLRYIARFDVGCLPSRYKAESLPTVIIEYLILGKPVVATAVGEIARMIDAEGGAPAGMLIELDSEAAMVEQMKAALMHLYRGPAARGRLSVRAQIAARKFDMDKCVDEYLAVYESARG